MSQYAGTPRFALMRVGFFTSYSHLYVYDSASLVQYDDDDVNNPHRSYIVPVVSDETSTIDLRGLRPLSSSPYYHHYDGTDLLYSVERIVGFAQTMCHLVRRNLYAINGDLVPPLNPAHIMRHIRDGDAFRACLKECLASIQSTKTMRIDLAFTIRGRYG
jgi:hypothetical protein